MLSDIDDFAEENAAEAESAGVNECAEGHAVKVSGCQVERWLAVEVIKEAFSERGSRGRSSGHERWLRGRKASGSRRIGLRVVSASRASWWSNRANESRAKSVSAVPWKPWS